MGNGYYYFIERQDVGISNLVCEGADYEKVFSEGVQRMKPYLHYVIKQGNGHTAKVLWEANITSEHAIMVRGSDV